MKTTNTDSFREPSSFLSNPDHIMFPGTMIRKESVVDYYDWMYPLIAGWILDRPLMIHTYPDGIDDENFYFRKRSSFYPKWIYTLKIPTQKPQGKKQNLIICKNKDTLLYAVAQGCLTPHVWLSKIPELNNPDKLIFDLDPASYCSPTTARAAGILKSIFDEMKVHAFLMTTGSRGLHVVVPLDGKSPFEASLAFSRQIADFVTRNYPETFTAETDIDLRDDKTHLNFKINSYGQGSVVPYSLRARRNAPVACPIFWKELEDEIMHSRYFTFNNILNRSRQVEDPWGDFLCYKYNLEKMSRKFSRLFKTPKSSIH